MLIGIDGNEANVEKKVGISEYAFELLKQFANPKSQAPNRKFIIYLKDAPRADMPKGSESWQYKVVKPAKLWTQFGLPLDLYTKSPKPDVFFTPSHYAPRISPVPTVVSIMDVSYVRFPELFNKKDLYQLKNWTAYSVKNASKVLTISNASKRDIIDTYGVSENKIVVTYPGIKQESRSMNNEVGSKSNQEYILFVGTLQPRKNIVRLIEAFSILSPKHTHLKLIIAGKKGWMYEEILSAPEKFGVSANVIFKDFVSDAELAQLYKDALCFVLPSLYEGFGLPVLEAMQYGCPVITSSTSSLPEVGGDAAEYIDPENTQDVARVIEKVISSPKLQEEMKEKGYKQVKKFNWEKTAKETLQVLEEVAGKN